MTNDGVAAMKKPSNKISWHHKNGRLTDSICEPTGFHIIAKNTGMILFVFSLIPIDNPICA